MWPDGATTPARPRPGWWSGRAGAVGLALAVGIPQVGFTILAGLNQPERRDFDVLAFLLLAAGPVALLARRRYPSAVLGVAFATTLAYVVIGYPQGPVFLGLIVALFNAVLSERRLMAWLTLGVGFVSFLWLPALLDREDPPSLTQVLGLGAWLLVLGTVAEVLGSRRANVAEAARSRAEHARRQASEERLRIARELHDVLAHNISLINVQAGVALHLIDRQPDQARTALSAIKTASKEALDELRSVLGVLRQVDEEAPRWPAASLGDLGGLVTRAAAAGLAVDLRMEGSPRPLPSGISLAAFRIVQESLTNVTRHAGVDRATVIVVYGDQVLTVQVDDEGGGVPARPATASTGRVSGEGVGSGSGIAGMAERTIALGGELEAGPRPVRGFRVRARFPLPEGT